MDEEDITANRAKNIPKNARYRDSWTEEQKHMQSHYDRKVRQQSDVFENPSENLYRLQRHRELQHEQQVSVDII